MNRDVTSGDDGQIECCLNNRGRFWPVPAVFRKSDSPAANFRGRKRWRLKDRRIDCVLIMPKWVFCWGNCWF